MLRAHVADALVTAGQRTASDLTSELQRRAREAGWPTDAATHVNVRHTGGAFEAHFAGAEDWEFGTEDRPPLAIARPFNVYARDEADPVFDSHLRRELGGLL